MEVRTIGKSAGKSSAAESMEMESKIREDSNSRPRFNESAKHSKKQLLMYRCDDDVDDGITSPKHVLLNR